jgi:hypothetical protein
MPTTYAIPDGRTVMAATIYTGNGTARNISNAVNGVSFQPDFVWLKNRGTAYGHVLQDSIRGTSVYLASNSTAAETAASLVTAFNSDGFAVSTSSVVNENIASIVGWQWKAGGTAVSNTAGTITSSVSANTTAGFSVVTYTGNGTSGATVGHGLGVAPSMYIVKVRSTTESWITYHTSIGATNYLALNLTQASSAATAAWNNTAPTSTVFSLGNAGSTNGSGSTFVAYCFAAVAGYSAFGSYTGNGSADGPFVYTGFRPRLMMWKRTDATADWYMWDTTRDTYNGGGKVLWPNYNLAETDYGTGSSGLWDILSNGFKLRTNSGGMNTNGANMIYMAFAESPFKFANAR